MADSVIESIDTWCKTHNEIVCIENAIKMAEAEHDMLLLAIWGAGPRICARICAEAALRTKIEAMKERVDNLKAINDIGHGALLVEIKKDMMRWQIERRRARRKEVKAIVTSAKKWPTSWHIAPLENNKRL
jgi:hypothetical protein